MDLKFLDFEQPIAELEAKIDELRYASRKHKGANKKANERYSTNHFFSRHGGTSSTLLIFTPETYLTIRPF